MRQRHRVRETVLHTILNLSNPGFDVVQSQVADLGLQAFEVHLVGECCAPSEGFWQETWRGHKGWGRAGLS